MLLGFLAPRHGDISRRITSLPHVPAFVAAIGAILIATNVSSADAPATVASATATATGTATAAKIADKDATKEKEPGKASTAKNSRTIAGFTPEREAAALTFVRANHPELADLLDRLKARRPQDYEKAIRDLFRVSEKLALSRETFPVRYELELKQWKLTSRIQVLSARLSMKRTKEQEDELKQLLAEQLEVHRELLAFNLDRAQNRAAMLQKDLDDLDAGKQAILDAKFEKAIKAAAQRKPAGKAAPAGEKNAAEKKSDDQKTDAKKTESKTGK